MKKYMLICLFGAAGSISRYIVGVLSTRHIPQWLSGTDFPLGTLIVNMIGCLLLPFIFIYVREKQIVSEKLVAAIGTGFVGGFTTFSAFTVDSITLFQDGKFLSAFMYVMITLVCGLAATVFSIHLSMRLQKPNGHRQKCDRNEEG